MIQIGKKRISIFMIIGMYLLIYNPPVFTFGTFRFNGVWPVMFISLGYVLLHLKSLKEQMNFRAIVRTEAVLGAMLAYLMAVALIHRQNMTQYAYCIYWMAADIPFALACTIHLRRRGLGFTELLDHLLITGTIMALTAVAAFLIPAVNEYFTDRMVAYGIPYSVKQAAYRNFGFAANLISTASYVQGVLACIALYRAIRGRKIWLAVFPILAFSANINTRTSTWIILAGMAAGMFAVLFSRDRRLILLTFGGMVLAAAVAFFGLRLVQAVNPRTYEWLTNGIVQVSSFVSGGQEAQEGYFGELNRMVTAKENIPQGPDLIFGSGTSIMSLGQEGIYADMGFINDLWRGGILYLVTIIALYVWTLWRFIRGGSLRIRDGVFLAALFLAAFGIINIKGSFFIHSDVTVLFWILVPPLVWEKTERG